MNNTTTKRVKFWTRIVHETNEEWKLVEGNDPSQVPVKAWKALNKAFWDWKQKNLLWPLDELEAYQVAAQEMVRVAENPPHLKHASLATYLVATAFKCLLKFRERQVAPTRETYREVCDTCRVDDKLDVQAFVESIPGSHSATREAKKRLAKEIVDETLAKLDPDVQRGLRAFLAANGVWTDAARIYNPEGSVPGYIYRFRHIWAVAFKEVCTWNW